MRAYKVDTNPSGSFDFDHGVNHDDETEDHAHVVVPGTTKPFLGHGGPIRWLAGDANHHYAIHRHSIGITEEMTYRAVENDGTVHETTRMG